ncbi:hypothetical protein CXB51_014751 [Gossypium anomalum]|uniref:Aspartic peptidase DDI1-type domain-containing protein n=1 Tax=Gossypium anomalum TaxID=47600 RepID=A0A8J5YZM7_9ROSI|nr:hypothetical protein CXB51_014751 [Gossypium anomalum]
MAENQENPLPPAIAADQVNQNHAPRTMYDYAKPNLTGIESSIDEDPNAHFDGFRNTLRCMGEIQGPTAKMIDAAAGGTIKNKTPKAAYKFIEEISLNNYQWQVMRTKPTKTAGVYNVDAVNMLSNQVELLNKKIDGLLGSTQVHPVMRCDSSGGGIHTEYQPFNPTTEEEQGGQGNQRPQNPLGFQQPPYQLEKKPNLEEMLSKFITVSETHFQNTETALKNQQASIQGLETQIGQLSKLIFDRPQGSLPSNTEPNPREQLNAINISNEEGLIVSEPEPKKEAVEIKGKALLQMPNAMKFLKELLANKRKLDEASHVELNAVCSAILQNKLPNKLKDQGSFTIPYLIGSLDVNNALADLGASINVMPYKMFKQLSLGKSKQTRMSIQLADKTIRFPRGIIEDVLVKIDKFIFAVDFVVLDIEEDSNTPLILGKPFLATARIIIDVGIGELTLRVGDETITLQARNSNNTSKVKDGCINHSTKTDQMVQPTLQEMSSKNIHEPC